MSKYWKPGPEAMNMQGFQLISTSIRRDGVHHRSHGIFPKLADAMGALTKLEMALEPCWVAGVRGLPVGCTPDNFEDYKIPVKESRPFKLYAIKASVYPVPRYGDTVWEATWGRDEKEARCCFLSKHKKPPLHILTVQALELEQEKDLLLRRAQGLPITSDIVEQYILWNELNRRGGAVNA